MRNPRLKAVTRKDILETARGLAPGTIQKWSVVVPVSGKGKRFPVKQLVREAANRIPARRIAGEAPRATPADFIAHEAVRILNRLNFVVDYDE